MSGAPVSRQCQVNMHLHCEDTDCACGTCHKRCRICERVGTRATLVMPEHEAVPPELRGLNACAECYLAFTAGVPLGQGCEVCGAPYGYRSLGRDPEGLYRCGACHEKSGTGVPGPSS